MLDVGHNPEALQATLDVATTVLGGRRTVVVLGVVSLLTDLSSEMIYPLLPVFLTAPSGRGPEPAFEVGVLPAVTAKDGFDAQILTGISLGAFNAALLASHPGTLAQAATRLSSIWLDRLASEAWTGRNGFFRYRGDVRSFLNPTHFPGAVAALVGDGSHWMRDTLRHGARMVRSGDDLAPRMLWFADLSSLPPLDPLADLVREVVDHKALRKSSRRLRIATADWVSGRVEIHEGSGLDGKIG